MCCATVVAIVKMCYEEECWKKPQLQLVRIESGLLKRSLKEPEKAG
jgi:hypothetical protein